MEESRIARTRVRSLSVIMGTAFQRAALRMSNFAIVGFAIVALVSLPEVLTAPIIIASLLLFSGNTFLGASDEALLGELLDDLGDEHAKALSLPGKAKALLTGGDDGAKQERLIGHGRDLYQRLVKCRKELSQQLERSQQALVGIDVADVETRLDTLQQSSRSLAVRHGRLSKMVEDQTAESLREEAAALQKKSEHASSNGARADFMHAAEEKRRHAETIGDIVQGIEDIDAKLENILSSLESYRARIAALSARGQRESDLGADIEGIVTGLTDEAEDLERMLEVLGQ